MTRIVLWNAMKTRIVILATIKYPDKGRKVVKLGLSFSRFFGINEFAMSVYGVHNLQDFLHLSSMKFL